MRPDNGPTTLYRFFDQAGALLYVGVAANPLARLNQHAIEKLWIDDVSTITLEHFDTRRAALDAEHAAIRIERPRHNQHLNEANPDRAPFALRPWSYPRGTCKHCGERHAINQAGRIVRHNSSVTQRYGRCPGSGCPAVRTEAAV